MFGLGFWEIIVILTIGLLVLGPKQLPKVARTIGRSLGELRRTADDFKREISSATDLHSDYEQPRHKLTSTPTQLESQQNEKSGNE